MDGLRDLFCDLRFKSHNNYARKISIYLSYSFVAYNLHVNVKTIKLARKRTYENPGTSRLNKVSLSLNRF